MYWQTLSRAVLYKSAAAIPHHNANAAAVTFCSQLSHFAVENGKQKNKLPMVPYTIRYYQQQQNMENQYTKDNKNGKYVPNNNISHLIFFYCSCWLWYLLAIFLLAVYYIFASLPAHKPVLKLSHALTLVWKY